MKILKSYGIRWIFVLALTGIVGCSNNDSFEIVEETVQLSGADIYKGLFFLESKFAEQIPILKNANVYEVLGNIPEVREDVDKIADLIVRNINYNNPTYFDEFLSSMKSGDQYAIQNAIDSGVLELQEAFGNIFDIESLTAKELRQILDEEDIEKYITPEGEIDKVAFQSLIEKNMADLDVQKDVNPNNAKCINVSLVITTIAVLGIVVLIGAVIAIAAAVNGGAIINLGTVVNVVAAVNLQVEINTSGGGGENGGPGPGAVTKMADNLQFEMLVDQLANFAY